MKTWTETEIVELLTKSDRAVEKAIVAIYRRQTPDEKATKHTSKVNGMGYSKHDAEFMSSLAEWVLRGRTLTPRQLAIGRNKIKRYRRQLTEVANEKEAEKAPAQAVEPQPAAVLGCTCAEHEWYDGEDVCPACHAAGVPIPAMRAAEQLAERNARTWG